MVVEVEDYPVQDGGGREQDYRQAGHEIPEHYAVVLLFVEVVEDVVLCFLSRQTSTADI